MEGQIMKMCERYQTVEKHSVNESKYRACFDACFFVFNFYL